MTAPEPNADACRRCNPIPTLGGALLALIALFTFLLKQPVAATEGGTISWLEAAFTATSAVTLTGLAAVDTAARFSIVGKALILLAIQLGAIVILAAGAHLASSICPAPSPAPPRKITALLRNVAFTTLGIESLAAILMLPLWRGELELGERLGLSVFHAVTAFCNAGFSLRSDSLAGMRYGTIAHLLIAPLIVLGALGWPVLQNLLDMAQKRAKALSLHSKIAIGSTAAIYLAGTLLITASQLAPRTYDFFKLGNEPNKTIYQQTTLNTVGTAVADAGFTTLAARTSGLHTVPTGELTPATNVTLLALMAFGGSPGGTAGGVKTIVVALLFFNLLAAARRENQVTIFGVIVPEQTLRHATAVAVSFVLLVLTATWVLSLSEPAPFLKTLFEVTSASSNSGLSLGITGSLTGLGKGVLIVCMILGRLGPFAVAVLLLAKAPGEGDDEVVVRG